MTDLPRIGRIIVEMTTKAFPEANQKVMQIMCMTEEAGEALKEARRLLEMARKPGQIEWLAEEVADTVIAAYAVAEAFEFDLDKAIADKAGIVLSRGWREANNPFTPVQQDR